MFSFREYKTMHELGVPIDRKRISRKRSQESFFENQF